MADSLRVQTYSIVPVAGPELTDPIIQELESIFRTKVETSSFDTEPPAAGMTEIAFTIVATGAFGLAFSFFQPLVTALGEEYRDEVLRLIRRGRRSKESHRSYIPLQIGLGNESSDQFPDAPIRYYFHDEIDEAELLKRMEAADRHLQSIPPEHLSAQNGPAEYGFFWDTKTQQWRGCIYGYPEPAYGEFWLPFKGWDPEK